MLGRDSARSPRSDAARRLVRSSAKIRSARTNKSHGLSLRRRPRPSARVRDANSISPHPQPLANNAGASLPLLPLERKPFVHPTNGLPGTQQLSPSWVERYARNTANDNRSRSYHPSSSWRMHHQGEQNPLVVRPYIAAPKAYWQSGTLFVPRAVSHRKASQSHPFGTRMSYSVPMYVTVHYELGGRHDQSSSASRVTAGAAGFFTLSQQSARPGRYGDPRRFDTMPSQPSAQACS
jgi:hypothetical protein